MHFKNMAKCANLYDNVEKGLKVKGKGYIIIIKGNH